MYFDFNCCLSDFLFKNWNIHSYGGLAGLGLSVVSVSVLQQMVKYLYLNQSNIYQNGSDTAIPTPSSTASLMDQEVNEAIDNTQPQITNSEVQVVGMNRRKCQHLTKQTLAYSLQVMVEYFLMLVVMTMNSWLLIAVVFGAALGYFIFVKVPPRVFVSETIIRSPSESQGEDEDGLIRGCPETSGTNLLSVT